MAATVRATFDGEVLRPEHPVDLEPNTTYVVTIEHEESAEEVTAEGTYPLSEIGRLAVDMGITDLAAHHDRYTRPRVADESGGA